MPPECILTHGMVATLYTETLLRSALVRSALHSKTAQALLAERLREVFVKRGLSGRGVARAVKTAGKKMSNKTVSNMLNGVGAPQFDKLMAVADHIQIPLWQLLCPGIDASHFGEAEIHRLVEAFCSLSEIRRARMLQNIEDAAIAEDARRPFPNSKAI